MKVCKTCGLQLPDNVNVCPRCGRSLAAGSNGTANVLLGALIGAVAVVALAVGCYFIFSGDDGKSPTPSSNGETTTVSSDNTADTNENGERSDENVSQASETPPQKPQIDISAMRSAYLQKLTDNLRYVEDGFGMCGYFLFDITGDGIPELMTKTGTCEADYELSIYCWRDGALARLYNGGADHSSFYTGSNYDKSRYVLVSMAHMGYQKVEKLSCRGGHIVKSIVHEHNPDNPDDDVDYYEPAEAAVSLTSFNNSAPVLRATAQ